jgi:hypothetical protein
LEWPIKSHRPALGESAQRSILARILCLNTLFLRHSGEITLGSPLPACEIPQGELSHHKTPGARYHSLSSHFPYLTTNHKVKRTRLRTNTLKFLPVLRAVTPGIQTRQWISTSRSYEKLSRLKTRILPQSKRTLFGLPSSRSSQP